MPTRPFWSGGLNYLSECDIKLENEVLLVESVLWQELRSAGVGTDAAHHIVNTKNSVTALLKLIVMSLLCQLFLSILRSIEAEFIRGGESNSAAAVCNGHIAAAVVAGVLLWLDVILVQLLDLVSEDIVVRGSSLIDVALVRTVALILNIGKSLWHKESEAESWQISEVLDFLLAYHLCADVTLFVDLPCGVDVKELGDYRSSHTHMALDNGNAVLNGSGATVYLNSCIVVAMNLPKLADISVVIGRRTPDVELHWLCEKLGVHLDHRLKGAGLLAEDIVELIGCDVDLSSVLKKVDIAALKFRSNILFLAVHELIIT